MRGKWLVARLIRKGAKVNTPNGEGVVIGSMLKELGHMVLVDHGWRGEGGLVEATAYPREKVEEVARD